MNRVAVQFLDQGFHRMLFDAMPMPVFVVDEDVRILECNAAAAKLLGKSKQFLVGKRCGEALNCIHAREVPEGCGRSPDCGGCVVRKSVRAASQGRSVIRQEAKMQFGHNGSRTKANLRVTCQPFTYERRTFILLILEGLNS
ncbi:MAG: PAS domain-containing protein [Limisphaerales bacterium]